MIRTWASVVLPLPVVLGVYAVAPMKPRDHLATVTLFVVAMAAFIALMAWCLLHVRSAARPVIVAIASVMVTVPILVVLFAYVYVTMSATNPDSFTEPLTRVDALYFATSTFATVGFGDISALSQTARAMVTLQIALDLAVIGGVLRLYLSVAQKRRAEGTMQWGPQP